MGVMPALTTAAPSSVFFYHSAMAPKHYGVRTRTHKLIHYPDNDEWEMFDLVSDPNEVHNLYGKPGNAELERELIAEMERCITTLKIPPKDLLPGDLDFYTQRPYWGHGVA